MLRILDLIEHRNHHLEQFYSLNENELTNIARLDYSNLELFYNSREKILENIRYIDSEMNIEQKKDIQLTNEQKKEIATGLAVKEEYVTRILAQDLEILSCIESAKSSIIRELQEMKRARKAVGSYKSRSFSNRIDEEA